MEPLEPLPPTQSATGGRGAASSQAGRGRSGGLPRSEAADQRPSPPVATGRRPAGALPLQASYRFDESANQVVVALIRPDTQEVVRQFPPAKILQLIADIRLRVAQLIDKRA